MQHVESGVQNVSVLLFSDPIVLVDSCGSTTPRLKSQEFFGTLDFNELYAMFNEPLETLKDRERVFPNVNRQEIFLSPFLSLDDLGDQSGVELDQLVRVKVGLVQLVVLIPRELVTWQEHISYVLAKGTLESLKIKADNFSDIPFPDIRLICCQI